MLPDLTGPITQIQRDSVPNPILFMALATLYYHIWVSGPSEIIDIDQDFGRPLASGARHDSDVRTQGLHPSGICREHLSLLWELARDLALASYL